MLFSFNQIFNNLHNFPPPQRVYRGFTAWSRNTQKRPELYRMWGWAFYTPCISIHWHGHSKRLYCVAVSQHGLSAATSSITATHSSPLTVMEGKWSDGWLLAAPSQMAAGTALRLADNQRTSKLMRALKPISAQSQEAKGADQWKGRAMDKDCGSQRSQQAWKWAALAFFCACTTHFLCSICL